MVLSSYRVGFILAFYFLMLPDQSYEDPDLRVQVLELGLGMRDTLLSFFIFFIGHVNGHIRVCRKGLWRIYVLGVPYSNYSIMGLHTLF